ncbi:MAG: Flp pilus assembly complex ATPase component TadA [Defluviitaleaceae bacterium]|nr:Flp pilus assembly complex ATPase component TadA [Defluviitaleaceae bacterium]MCL2274300.1 Flp pilus assembly complex ATPase component TadA [Defluviitaleaceae bacterium]
MSAPAQPQQIRLGDVLKEAGYVTEEQIQAAFEYGKSLGVKKRLGELLLESNVITEVKLNTALSRRLNVRYVSMRDAPIELEAVKQIPKAIASKHCLIAIAEKPGALVVNINDPLDYYAIEDIKLITSKAIEIQVCNRAEIMQAISESYAEIETRKAATGANATAISAAALGYVDISETADDTPIVTLLNSTLYKAHTSGASDVHIEPFEEQTQFRIRVDGLIVDYLTLSVSLHNSIVARIKILAGMDVAEKRAPQDGHFRAKLQDIDINVRVSSLPTVFGEKIVMRFMGQGGALDNAGTFGMEQDDYEKMLQILQVPHGVIYLTGPTGSGKTTTLYMIMEMLAKRNVNISTVEDPVERNLARINQTQINPLAGLTFESALRSILRQDPDIILIGETRDAETASIGVRAALTGHLVLSSLHTNDAVSSIVRLVDMGVEDYLLANSLAGVVAQRLVKKVCQFCSEEYAPTENELRIMGNTYPITSLIRGKGCHNCNSTGYKGRVSIHEILTIDPKIRSMISSGAPTEEIYKYVRAENKMKFLQTSLKKLVYEKKTTIDELLKLTYFVE